MSNLEGLLNCRKVAENWKRGKQHSTVEADLAQFLSEAKIEEIDPFDRPQLSYVLSVCKDSKSLSEAGRKLFSVSREKRKTKNDGDRLKKYLAKFNLSFEDCDGLCE